MCFEGGIEEGKEGGNVMRKRPFEGSSKGAYNEECVLEDCRSFTSGLDKLKDQGHDTIC
jgi:hypothetical protein